MKNKTIATYITALGIAGTVLATLYIGAINPATGFPEPITVNGQTIEFTWTDDNSGEDLIIYTDKSTYTDGLSHATVYVAVENHSSKDQEVELMGYFRDSKQKISDIAVLTEITQDVPTYETRTECVDVIATSTKKKNNVATTTCSEIQTQTGTTTEVYNAWQPLDQKPRDVLEKAKEVTKLDKKARKSVENFIAETKSVGYLVPTDGVIYYKVNVEFPANTSDNFYFEAIGDKGAYSHLDPWFNASWDYKVKVEVNPNKVGTSTAITSFPVYLNLADLPAGFHTNVKGDGCDIRVVESDDTTETAFELVAYATSTDTGELHFMADALATTSTSTFYVYYGNSAASCYAVTDTYGRNAVWGAYQGVWHMNTSSSDSTSNGRNGTDTNITYTTGQLGGAASNLSKNGKIAVGSWSLTSAFTVSAWLRLDAVTGVQTAFSTYNGTGVGSGTANGYVSIGAGELGYSNFSVDIGWSSAPNRLSTSWAFVYWRHDGTTARVYINGTEAKSGTAAHVTTTRVFNWLSRGDETTQRMDGYVDEGKVVNSLLSLDWLATEYNNQSSPSTFYYIGPEETDAPAAASTDSGAVIFD